MIRLSKMADYGIVLSSYIANAGDQRSSTARELAAVSQLPLPTVSKVLKGLSRAGLLVAHRGKQGGYSLALDAADISVADMISAIDGPITLTECSSAGPSLCDIEQSCPVRSNWQRITGKVRQALEELSLADMTPPANCRSHTNNQMTQLGGGPAKVVELFSNQAASPQIKANRSQPRQPAAKESVSNQTSSGAPGRNKS